MPDQLAGPPEAGAKLVGHAARCDAMAGWDRLQCHGWHIAELWTRGTSMVATFGGALALMFIWLLWRAQRDRDNPIDVTEWLRDPATGLTSRRALGELVGLFVSTFGVVAFGMSDMDPAWKVTAYMFYSLLWVARSLLGAFLQMRFGGGQDVADRDQPPPPPPAVTTTTTTAVVPPVPPATPVAPIARLAVAKRANKKGPRRRGQFPAE